MTVGIISLKRNIKNPTLRFYAQFMACIKCSLYAHNNYHIPLAHHNGHQPKFYMQGRKFLIHFKLSLAQTPLKWTETRLFSPLILET